jgi:hypothetical protein
MFQKIFYMFKIFLKMWTNDFFFKFSFILIKYLPNRFNFLNKHVKIL